MAKLYSEIKNSKFASTEAIIFFLIYFFSSIFIISKCLYDLNMEEVEYLTDLQFSQILANDEIDSIKKTEEIFKKVSENLIRIYVIDGEESFINLIENNYSFLGNCGLIDGVYIYDVSFKNINATFVFHQVGNKTEIKFIFWKL